MGQPTGPHAAHALPSQNLMGVPFLWLVPPNDSLGWVEGENKKGEATIGLASVSPPAQLAPALFWTGDTPMSRNPKEEAASEKTKGMGQTRSCWNSSKARVTSGLHSAPKPVVGLHGNHDTNRSLWVFHLWPATCTPANFGNKIQKETDLSIFLGVPHTGLPPSRYVQN